MACIADLVVALERQIEAADRNPSDLFSTQNLLGADLAGQVHLALSEEVFSPGVETDLVILGQLFKDLDHGMTPNDASRRFVEAKTILRRFSQAQARITSQRESEPLDARIAGEESQGRPDHPVKRTVERATQDAPMAREGTHLWEIPIRYAKGVGPKRAALFEKIGVTTLEDAMWLVPRRYEDRSVTTAIADIQSGMRATICGTIASARGFQTARRRMHIFDVTVEDESGKVSCLYFNQPYLEGHLKVGARVMMTGMVAMQNRPPGRMHLNAPQCELLEEEDVDTLHVGRVVPLYHETKGLTSRHIRTVIHGLLEDYLPGVEEPLPSAVIARQELMPLRQAFAQVHFPPPLSECELLDRGVSSAHGRLAFEELLYLQLAWGLRVQSLQEEAKGIRFDSNTPLLSQLRRRLPFQLTSAQERVVAEIVHDMATETPMHRLIQGDVGCGKTIVALHAMVMACGSGYQTGFMVPTEILAEQHFLTLKPLLEELGLTAVLLTSGIKKKHREALATQVQDGGAHVVIGTHALIQKNVQFHRLGLAVIDEQHKFGVLQRKLLLEKGYQPDVLVLTATPIPRTLAMTAYGDLDVSVIDALPPGRKPIRTMLFGESQRQRAFRLLSEEVRAGRQAYVVYPLVEDSEKIKLKSAIEYQERLQAGEFQAFKVGLLHGHMSTEQRESTMAAFKSGVIHILVTTTVVEVGVDVPNATVMLIEHADRFGLAQLHQLRGRVGRGPAQSYCFLLSSSRHGAGRSGEAHNLSVARQRLEILVKSSDGFFIAEEDLRIRGPGEVLGVRQWGIPEFRVANLVQDSILLERAKREAMALLVTDPQLTDPRHTVLRASIIRRWGTKLELGKIS